MRGRGRSPGTVRRGRRRLFILKLSAGWRSRLIKAPLTRLAAREPQAACVTINRGEVYIAEDIRGKSFGLDGGIEGGLTRIREALGRMA